MYRFSHFNHLPLIYPCCRKNLSGSWHTFVCFFSKPIVDKKLFYFVASSDSSETCRQIAFHPITTSVRTFCFSPVKEIRLSVCFHLSSSSRMILFFNRPFDTMAISPLPQIPSLNTFTHWESLKQLSLSFTSLNGIPLLSSVPLPTPLHLLLPSRLTFIPVSPLQISLSCPTQSTSISTISASSPELSLISSKRKFLLPNSQTPLWIPLLPIPQLSLLFPPLLSSLNPPSIS